MPAVIFPPRPVSSVPPDDLPRLERLGIYVAQPKYQGSRIVINIRTEGGQRRIDPYNRHGGKHKSYLMSEAVKRQLRSLPGLEPSKEYWLDGEVLIKTSAKDTKNKIVLFDVLQAGRYLFGVNQMKRLEMLRAICGDPQQWDELRRMALVVSPDVMLSPVFESNFQEEFIKDRGEEVEGLVLRERNSVLDNFGGSQYNVQWIVRCRKEHKNYSF